ncbi:MAG: sigma-70 family RNA polymerase sigma factor [Planctomycetes bacterium]|nr:sigma-70 family RNA polymerase sigma factor [Planctomycetota bacterium]
MSAAEETRDLILAARRGDLAACGALYDRLAPAAQRFVCALGLNLAPGEVEDVLQETFLRLLGTLEAFDLERPLIAWTLGIARRVALEQARKRKPSAQLPEVAADARSASERLSRQETDHLVRDALEALTPDDRAALALRHTSRLSMRELAESLACSIPTARARLRAAAHRFAIELRARGVAPSVEAS